MATWIGLMCLLWAAGVLAQCGDGSWYGGSLVSPDEQSSVEDRAPSFEEASDEFYPSKQQRYLRSSRYSAVAGYGNELQPDSGDWERYSADAAGRNPARYDAHRTRRKYSTYGKSSRTGYGYKSTPDAGGYERRKTSRAAKYVGSEGGSYGKTTALTYKAVPPKPNCAQNLLIGCTPTVTRVPCSASAPYETYGAQSGAAPYYPPVPMYHHAPPVYYGPSHPPPSYPGYEPFPSGVSYPPAAYSKPAAASGAHQKPGEGTAPGYGASYKVATQEEVPAFAAPVQEELRESPKAPLISAFHKATPDGTATGPAATNGTAGTVAGTSTAKPMPLLTTTTEANEDNDEFWAVESNTESSTDVVEGSTVR